MKKKHQIHRINIFQNLRKKILEGNFLNLIIIFLRFSPPEFYRTSKPIAQINNNEPISNQHHYDVLDLNNDNYSIKNNKENNKRNSLKFVQFEEKNDSFER